MFKKIKQPKFKKQKIINLKKSNKKKSKLNIISKISWIIAAFLVLIIWYWIVKQIWNLEFSLDGLLNIAWFDINIEELKTQTPIKKSPEWKTNIIILWRDVDQDDFIWLTDSIIFASINFDKDHVTMLSIPRDMYVEFSDWNSWKINEAFYRGYKRWKSIESWIKEISYVVERITWEEINYYVTLDFNWFIEIIDILWWIEIDVPHAIVDNYYPGPNYSYQTFRISAWLQNLDWETALKYARSRKTTSDFDRSMRQQLIIKAVRDKVISLDLLTSPIKIKAMYDAISKNVNTNLEFSQLLSLWMYVKNIPRDNIYSFNLNNSCFENNESCSIWWIMYDGIRSDFNWMSVLLPYWANKFNLSNYNNTQIFTNIILNHPKAFDENLQIHILNSTNVPWLAWNLALRLKRFWFNVPSNNATWNIRWNTYSNSKIYYSSDVKPETVKALELIIFGWSENIESMPKYSNNPNNKIEIVIGSDFKILNL